MLPPTHTPWPAELSLPAGFDDDDFLALIQKQMAAANSQALLLNPAHYSASAVNNISPPSSEESSPSPPQSFREPEESTNNTRKQSQDLSRTNDDDLKRKAADDDSDDDESGQPSHKTHHGAANDSASGSKGSRKKSGQDEGRLLKRKEQNRAAQRAFRERKEKHVKDLEDKVAALEAKSQTQTAENENLRDLLGRLQSENLLLKQSAFTFAVPQSTTAAQRRSSTASTQSSFSGSSFSQPYSNLFASSSTSPATSMTSPSPSALPTPASLASAFPTMNPDGRMPRHSPYVTIASDPLFTSYRDPTLDAWASFGPAPDDNMTTPPQPMTASPGPMSTFSDVNLGFDGLSSFGDVSGMDMDTASFQDLFGASFSDFGAFNSFSPGLGSTPSLSTGLSPPPSTDPANEDSNATASSSTSLSPAASAAAEGHTPEKCPKNKEDIERIIQSSEPSTFGPPVCPAEVSPLCAGLEQVAKNDTQIELEKAWEQVRRHPQFSECDIDSLCTELSAKAKCNGTKPVLDPHSMKEIVDSIPNRAGSKKSMGSSA